MLRYAGYPEEKYSSRCFISTAARVAVFLAQQGHLMSTNFQEICWLAKLSFLSEHKSFEFFIARKWMRRFWESSGVQTKVEVVTKQSAR